MSPSKEEASASRQEWLQLYAQSSPEPAAQSPARPSPDRGGSPRRTRMTSLPNSPGAAFREKYRELPSYKLEANPGETTEEKAARLKQQADRKKAAKAAAKARAAQTTAPTSPSLVAPATIPNPQSVRLNELVFAWPSGGSTPSGTAASTTHWRAAATTGG